MNTSYHEEWAVDFVEGMMSDRKGRKELLTLLSKPAEIQVKVIAVFIFEANKGHLGIVECEETASKHLIEVHKYLRLRESLTGKYFWN